MSAKNMSKKTLGYTLVEIAISMLVLSLLGGAFMQLSSVANNLDKNIIVKDKLDRIQAAIDAFYQKNGYIPCPSARSSATANDFSYRGIATDCSLASIVGTSDGGSANGAYRIGAVPVVALGLPFDYDLDPWGNKFTYTVLKNLAISKTVADGYAGVSSDSLVVKDINNVQINNGANMVTAYILLSHGQSSRGAYNANGAQSVACGSNLDSNNCNNDNIFVDSTIDNSKSNTSKFDGYLRWKSISALQIDAKDIKSVSTIPSAPGSSCSDPYNAIDFLPTSISDLKIWFDANDRNTVFSNTSCSTLALATQRVMCWKDKSGNNLKALSSSSSTSPFYDTTDSRWFLLFGGSVNLRIDAPTSLFSSSVKQMETFIVAFPWMDAASSTIAFDFNGPINFEIPGNSTKLCWYFNNNSGSNCKSYSTAATRTDNICHFNSAGTTPTCFRYSTQQSYYSSNFGYTIKYYNYYAENYQIYNSTANNQSGNTVANIFVNDQLFNTATLSASAPTSFTGKIIIAGRLDLSTRQDIDIAEILVFERVLTDEERMKVRSYLKYKWKL